MKQLCTLVLLCSSAFAISGGMQKATVYSMNKVPCMSPMAPQWSPQMAGGMPQMAGGDGRECMEYELRTEKVSYIIRPRRDVLLLLGGEVFIRLAPSELLLRTSDSPREVRCAVMAMSLRSEGERHERDRGHISKTHCIDEQGRPARCPTDAQ